MIDRSGETKAAALKLDAKRRSSSVDTADDAPG
jgi:hypothetical protein